MNAVKSFTETLISSAGSNLDLTEPVIARIGRQTDSAQLFLGSDYTPLRRRHASNSNEHSKHSTDLTTSDPGTESSSIEYAYYNRTVATAGSIIHCRSTDNFMPASFPSSVSWRVLASSTLIVLEPIDLNSNNNDSNSKASKFRSIHVALPTAIRDNCISVCYSPDHFEIIIDYVAKDWTFYTVAIPLSEMVVSGSYSMTGNSNFFTQENAKNWYRMDASPPFDLKQPHLVYSISPKIVIFALKDGSIMKIFRESALGPCGWDTFLESGKTISLSKLLWGQSDKFPMHPELSVRTVVSMTSACNNEILLTVSINRKLRAWHIPTMKLLFEETLTDSSILEDDGSKTRLSQRSIEKSLIGPSPMNIISVINESSTSFYFATYLPLGNGSLEVWSAKVYTSVTVSTGEQEASITVRNLGSDYHITPDILDPSAMWLVNTLHLAKAAPFSLETPSFEISVMWKSNTSSFVCKTQLPSKTTSKSLWHVAAAYEDQDTEYLRRSHSPAATHTDIYIKWLFGPEGYSQATVKTALQIYETHYALTNVGGLDDDDDNEENVDHNSKLYIKKKVCQAVGSAISFTRTNNNLIVDAERYKDSIRKEWERFDRLCTELERLGHEVLSMVWDPLGETFWVIKASFTSILRPLMPIELLYYNRSSSPALEITSAITAAVESSSALTPTLKEDITEPFVSRILQILDAMYAFRRSFSHAHYGGFVNGLIDDYTGQPRFSTEERMRYITSHLIDEEMSRETRGSLAIAIAETSSDPNYVYQLLLFLYNISTVPPTEPSTKKSNPSWMTTYGTSLLVRTLQEFTRTTKIVTTDSLITLFSLSLGPTNIQSLVKTYSKFLSLFKSLNAISEILSVLPAYKPSALKQLTLGEDIDMDSSKEDQLVSSYFSFFENITFIKQFQAAGILPITSPRLSQIVGLFWSKWNTEKCPTAAALLAAELLATENNAAAESFSESYLSAGNSMGSFDTFIQAHTALRGSVPSKALYLFKQSSVELAHRHLTVDETIVISRLPATSYKTEHREKDIPSFGNGLSAFYDAAAKTVDFWGGHSILALQLAKLARANLPDYFGEINEKDIPKVIQIHKTVQNNLFNLAIKTTSLDDAYTAIVELDMVHNFEAGSHGTLDNGSFSDVDTETLIAPYVARLATLATLTGHGSELTKYPFIGLTNVLTNFLVSKIRQSLANAVSMASSAINAAKKGSLANIDPITKDAFIFYNILYTWNVEHGDMRAASVALLLKIQHLKAKALIDAAFASIQGQANGFDSRKGLPNRSLEGGNYLEIIQAYAILVNALSCLQPTDQWVVGEVLTGSFVETALQPKFVFDEQKQVTVLNSTLATILDGSLQKETVNIQDVQLKVEQVVLKLDDIKKESQLFSKKHEQQLMSRVISMVE